MDMGRPVVACAVPSQHHPILAINKRVRIRRGNLNGKEGTLLAKDDDLGLLASIPIIQRSLPMCVTSNRNEPI
jgi:hypothetical protein